MFAKLEYSHDATSVFRGAFTFTSSLSSYDTPWSFHCPFAPRAGFRWLEKSLLQASYCIYLSFLNIDSSTPPSTQLLHSIMSLFWMILLATYGSAVALINDSAVPPHVQDLGVSTPRPATAGWDFDDFPETLLNDNSWENLKCKGDNLNKAMHSNDVEAGKLFNPPLLSVESQWDDFGMI